MLTPADELHVHQTPEPIAAAGTDRNFYDRSYVGAWTADGTTMVAGAFGFYPQLNVADAHVTIVRDGVQLSLHASRILHDRSVLAVGPISIEVVEPLRIIRFVVAEHDGIAAELTFTGRAAPLEEPRFIHRHGTRAFMDYTRLSQAARVTGWFSVDGERTELGEDALGFRDRSWGIRPIGLGDPQPVVPPVAPQFFWVWSPIHWADRTTFFHVNADVDGRPWNTRAAIAPDGAERIEHGQGRLTLELREGTRWPAGARLELRPDFASLGDLDITLEPLMHLEMSGLGYRHPEWTHGVYKGEEVVERESRVLADSDPGEMSVWHRQTLVRATGRHADGSTEQGTGLLELLILGPYAPLGLS